MIAQGVLSCSVGFISFAIIGPLNFIFFSQKRSDFPFFGKTISWAYIATGLLILASGVLNVLAGASVRRFQNRQMAIFALFTNAIYMFSFFSFPCLPFALALMIFGLVVMLNREVRRAFAGELAGPDIPEVIPQVIPALPADKPDWFGRNWRWLVPGVLLLPVLTLGGFGGCLFFGIQYGFKSSDVYKNALGRVQTDQTVTAALGSPIESGFTV